MNTHLHPRRTTFKSSDLLRDIVIGMSDGLTVPFALAAGLSGAVSSTGIIVIAGIAEICAVRLQWDWVDTLLAKQNRIIIQLNCKEKTMKWTISGIWKLQKTKRIFLPTSD